MSQNKLSPTAVKSVCLSRIQRKISPENITELLMCCSVPELGYKISLCLFSFVIF